jgi:hypothetical protein
MVALFSLNYSLTALHSGSGAGAIDNPFPFFYRVYALRLSGNQMTSIGGGPQVARRYGAWPCGAMSAVAHALGGGTEPSHLLQNKFYQLIRFVSMQLMHTMKVMMGVIFQGVDDC